MAETDKTGPKAADAKSTGEDGAQPQLRDLRDATILTIDEALEAISEVWHDLPDIVREWMLQMIRKPFLITINTNKSLLIDVTLRSARNRVLHLPEIRVSDSPSSRGAYEKPRNPLEHSPRNTFNIGRGG